MEPIVSPEDVETYLKLGPERDRAELVKATTAVDALVRSWVDDPEAEQSRFAAIMLAARIYRRRNSPAGVESIGEMGPVYVSRNDPDLAMMLGLGNYRKLKVG